MREVSVEELSNYKKLPFNLYNDYGEIIIAKNEEITPGLLLKLSYDSIIYADDDEIEEVPKQPDENEFKITRKKSGETQKKIYKKPVSQPVIEETDEESDEDDSPDFAMLCYENEMNCIPVKAQYDIKHQFKKALKLTLKEGIQKSIDMYCDVRDKVVEETLLAVDDVVYKSQLKVYGDYNYTHGINVAILSTLLAYKLRLPDTEIKDIALAAMLHDIGKIRIPKEIVEKPALTSKETKLLQLHPQIGYRIMKREMELPEHIAVVALEHHERNDGSGYPYGTSGDLISLPSQIVMVCDAFDNLVSNKGSHKIKNAKEAIKILLDGGSKWFTPSILYTFVYMSNYNDTLPLSQ